VIRNHLGGQAFPLSTGSSDNPTLTAGVPVSFNLQTVPIANGNMANYLAGLFVSISGNVVQSGGTGVAIAWRRLYNFLIDTLELRACWHGTPISPNHVKGFWLPTISYVGSGYRYLWPQHQQIPAANNTYAFNFHFFVPRLCGNGDKPHHTSLLALFYKQSVFSILPQAASVLSTFSPGATFTSLAARCSAILLPEPEIHHGPAVEWIDYQTPASSGQTQIPLTGFGNTTQLQRTEAGAGLLFQAAMANTAGQPGSFDPSTITRLSIPYRGQVETTHPQAYVGLQLACQGTRRVIGGSNQRSDAVVVSDYSDFPFEGIAITDVGTDAQDLLALTGFPLVQQAVDMETSKAQVVDGDSMYFLTLSSGPSGTHHTLTQHLRSWTPDGWDDAKAQVVNSGLAKAVLGTGTNLGWAAMPYKGQSVKNLASKKTRFLPMRLMPR